MFVHSTIPRTISQTLSAFPGSSLRFKIVFSIIRPIFFNPGGNETLTPSTVAAISSTVFLYVGCINAACCNKTAGSLVVCFTDVFGRTMPAIAFLVASQPSSSDLFVMSHTF